MADTSVYLYRLLCNDIRSGFTKTPRPVTVCFSMEE